MKTWMKPAGWLVFVCLFLAASPAWGQKAHKPGGTGPKAGPGALRPGGKEVPKETPIHITAARLEADQQGGVILFTGNVKADYGDSTLYCDQLWVYYQTAPQPQKPEAAAPAGSSPEGKPPEAKPASPLGELGGEKITRIVARGQVRMVQEDRVATGQEATYYKDRDEVVLVGNPQLWRGENTLKGEKIIFNLAANKVLVESSPQKRVEAHLYSAPQGAAGEKASLPFGPKAQKAGSQP